jgi:hypothetical protein
MDTPNRESEVAELATGGLTGKDFTEQRNDAMREGVKALLLMNGGGAVALLAFLQAIFQTSPSLAKYVVLGLAFLTCGLVAAGLVHLFRVHTSSTAQLVIELRKGQLCISKWAIELWLKLLRQEQQLPLQKPNCASAVSLCLLTFHLQASSLG